MDFKKSLNNVANLNGYMNFTQELVSTRKDVVVPFNMTTVLMLKKIRSLEVEYFSKHQESGAAFLILERMLSFPPSKTWSLLSVEIVNLLNYWLEALRKYIITHCPLWWLFFKAILGFVSEIRLKDPSVSNIVLKQSAEGLLDLGTSDKLSPEQRSEVVACLNQVCSHSSRDMRVALQETCAPYLVKLASDLACCSHIPTQFATLELLMRWLPNRQDRKIREAAAAVWFPATMYTEQTVAVFVERSFANFFKDAREFLNRHNAASGDIISVVCRKLTVGRLELISLSDKWESWLDIAVANGSLVAMVDVRRLQTLGLPTDLREHLTLTADNSQQAIAYRGPMQIQLSITTVTKPQLICKETQQLLDDQACEVNIWISSKCHFDSVHLALVKIFGDKYKCDDNRRLSELIQSSDSNRFSASEEDTRLSHPIEVTRPKRSGYVVNPKRASGWKSPSTTSTTSLAHLQEKLSAFPRLRYDKEPTGICVAPDLSCVTEISEPDDDSSFAFTAKTRPYGVCTRRRVVNRSKTSPSDNDEGFSCNKKYLSPVLDSAKEKSPNCLLSATIGAYEASFINDTLEAIRLNDDDEVVNLLAQEAFANVKEKDALQDSGINVSDKKNHNNSVIETRSKSQVIPNSSKNSNKVPCTVISKSSSEDTSASFQNVLNEYKSHFPINKVDASSNVIKSTTTDESNTEAINGTPVPFVNVRTKSLKGKKKVRATSVDSERNFKNIGQNLNKTVIGKGDSPEQFAANDIEDFFNHHVQQNKNGDLILSPTLARKVNETSSDTSDSFDKYLISNVDGRNDLQSIADFEKEQNFVDPEDVFGCLNQIIDKVCEDLDKCAEYMEKVTRSKITKNSLTKSPAKNVEVDSDFIPNTVSSTMNPLTKDKAKKSPHKLAFKNTKVKKAPVKKNKRNAKVQSPIKKAITPKIKEVNGDIEARTVEEVSPKPPKETVATKNVPAKRKRKLYSPKDADKQSVVHIPETEEDNSLPADVNPKLYTPKTTATSYKDIVKARKTRKVDLKPTNTRKRGKASKSPPMSPRSIKKNEMFDQLKENVENISIKLVDKTPRGHDLTVYNYTSESEDEDFKVKKIDLLKTKGTPIGSTGSKRTTRSRVNYSESRNNSSAEDGLIKKTIPKKKRAKQAAKSKSDVSKLLKEPFRDVIDERMRVATDGALNTSFVLEDTHKMSQDSELEPLSKFVKRMEPIPEVSIFEDEIVQEVIKPKKVAKRRCERVLSLKKSSTKLKINADSSANEDTSPLPALIIETVKTGRKGHDMDSISSSKLIQGCENIMKFGAEVDTTQNLLSDDDKLNYSPEQHIMPIELEIRKNLDKTSEDHIDFCNDDTSNVKSRLPQNEVVSTIEKKRKLCKEAIVKIKKETAILKSKTAKPNIIVEPEVIEIIEYNPQPESAEKSIATVGESPIRAHGTLNEDPPNEKLLKQQISTPRDVDFEMSPSMKNFCIQLYKEINIDTESKKQDSSQEETVNNVEIPHKKVATKQNLKTSVTENLNYDIVQSESEEDDHLQYISQIKAIGLSSPVVLLERSFDIITPKKSNAAKNPASSLNITSLPAVVLGRLDPEDIRKWMPSPKSTISEESREVFNILNENNKEVKPLKKVQAKNIPENRNKSIQNQEPNKSKTNIKPIPVRKSTISPIRDFDDREQSEPTDVQSKSITSLNKLTSPSIKENRTESNANVHCTRNITKAMASSTSEISIGKDVYLIDRKRQGAIEVVSPKKRRLGIEECVQTQASSVGSEWFQHSVDMNKETEGRRSAYIECLQLILEKLDTTLMEIHNNTGQNMVRFFVDMHRRSQEVSREMEARLQTTLAQLLQKFSGIAREHMTDYKEGCATLQAEHNRAMKVAAAKLIRADSQRKQTLINIIREDIENVLENCGRHRET